MFYDTSFHSKASVITLAMWPDLSNRISKKIQNSEFSSLSVPFPRENVFFCACVSHSLTEAVTRNILQQFSSMFELLPSSMCSASADVTAFTNVKNSIVFAQCLYKL